MAKFISCVLLFHLALLQLFVFVQQFASVSVLKNIAYSPVLEITNGKIRGTIESTPNEVKYYAFKGIPYGKPPIGEFRFMPPVQAENWTEIKDTINEVICIQVRKEISPLETEDCLTLNVYTPQLPNGQKSNLLPVMFHIFGGGFYIGNATFERNGPDFLIENDVIVVTANYRVGPFGFLSTGDKVIPGNSGLKDQVLALKWVQDNIKYFNGDPKKVTILGHSAGGASVSYQLLGLQSQGLFRAAIIQSGSSLCSWALSLTPQTTALKTAQLVDTNFTQTDSKSILTLMQSASAQAIRTASVKFYDILSKESIQELDGYVYSPVIEVEHPGAFLTEGAYEAFAAGHFHKVPAMIGMASEEMIDMIDDGTRWNATSFVPGDMNADEGKKDQIRREIKSLYNLDKSGEMDKCSLLKYYDDQIMLKPLRKQAELQIPHNDVYFYQFSYDGKMGNLDKTLANCNSVSHGEENNYLWRVNLPDFTNYDLSKFPQEDILTQKRLVKLWTNFAKYLNPTPTEEILTQNITWPKLSASKNEYLDIGKDLKIESDLRKSYYQKWEEIYSLYGHRPYKTY